VTGPNPSGQCQCGCGRTTTVAAKNHRQSGAVRGQHVRFCHGHAGSAAAKLKANAYWVAEPGRLATPCHVWQGALNSKGYPSRGIPGTKGKSEQVHRAALAERLGRPIAEGCQAHHRCENRKCVNAEHLEEKTPLEHKRAHRELGRQAVAA
jgi:hypothetical protein